ncbi:thyrotropin-releasing hormone receptor [Biomphalaria glabrata]|nr:thyrotropin-releasing hormone receptor-like [Biomphalaria glabrata]
MAQDYFNSSPPLTTKSQQELEDFLVNILDRVIFCCLHHLLCLSGALASILNIIILSKYGLHETTSILLFSMSVSDLFCSTLQPIRKLDCIVAQFDPLLAKNTKFYISANFFSLPDFFIAISTLHTAVIAVERLIAVCFPLKMLWIFTTYRVKCLVLFIYLYVVAMMMPTLFLGEILWTVDPKTNNTIAEFMFSQFYKSNFHRMNEFMYFALPKLLATFPLALITVCSIIIGYKIIVRSKITLTQMSSIVSREGKERKVVKMLLTVCVVNAGMFLPTEIINMYFLYSSTLLRPSDSVYFSLRSFYIIIGQIKATVNFIIYITMSSKFELILKEICYCRKKKKKVIRSAELCFTFNKERKPL